MQLLCCTRTGGSIEMVASITTTHVWSYSVCTVLSTTISSFKAFIDICKESKNSAINYWHTVTELGCYSTIARVPIIIKSIARVTRTHIAIRTISVGAQLLTVTFTTYITIWTLKEFCWFIVYGSVCLLAYHSKTFHQHLIYSKDHNYRCTIQWYYCRFDHIRLLPLHTHWYL